MLVVSENTMKWLLCLYPPLLLQRICVQQFSKGFKGVKVKINKSFLNRNYNGSIFGGTIFAAADPFLPVLFSQVLNPDGRRKLKIWSKSSKIEFLKPALTDLFFEIKLTEADIQEFEQALLILGKYEKAFTIQIYNSEGEVCVQLQNEVYVRDLDISKKLI